MLWHSNGMHAGDDDGNDGGGAAGWWQETGDTLIYPSLQGPTERPGDPGKLSHAQTTCGHMSGFSFVAMLEFVNSTFMTFVLYSLIAPHSALRT